MQHQDLSGWHLWWAYQNKHAWPSREYWMLWSIQRNLCQRKYSNYFKQKERFLPTDCPSIRHQHNIFFKSRHAQTVIINSPSSLIITYTIQFSTCQWNISILCLLHYLLKHVVLFSLLNNKTWINGRHI